MTRNGESASINVGQEVPTVTSQGSGSSQSMVLTGTTNVVPQTIQYRNTGVLLRVRPVIHAGDRIDLEVNQEVSSAEPTRTALPLPPPPFASAQLKRSLQQRRRHRHARRPDFRKCHRQ